MLIKIYESLINRQAEQLFDDLIEKSEIYRKMIEPDLNTELGRQLKELDYINTAPSYTLLMYLLSLSEDKFEHGLEQELLGIIDFIQKYSIRRNVTDTPSTRVIDQLNIDAVEACNQTIQDGNKISVKIISDIFLNSRHKHASLKELHDELNSSYFYYNSMSRYLLIKIDSMQHSREYKPNLWERNDKGGFVWTIEHIFPQGENIPKEWIAMMGEGDKVQAKEIHDTWAHALGNLTLSGYNSKLSNSSFEQKQAKTETKSNGHSIQIGYKNGLALNQLKFMVEEKDLSLATCKAWTLAEMEARHEVMIQLLCESYKFNHESLDDLYASLAEEDAALSEE
ncbi:MAG: hypothetical protein NVS3B3_13720 [Aquirhabdus sp.]